MTLCPDQKRVKANIDFEKFLMKHGATAQESRGASLEFGNALSTLSDSIKRLSDAKGITHQEALNRIMSELPKPK